LEYPFFTSLHNYATNLRASLLVATRVDAVCECRGYKAGYEKNQRNDYQQEKY